MKVKATQLSRMIATSIKAGQVAMVHGSPGCGKSEIIKSVAKQYGLLVRDFRLSQCDPTDLLGLPTVKNGRFAYAPNDSFPIEGDSIPEGYNGWLLLFDEISSAPKAVQAASYRIILDKEVGAHKLHKNVAIVAAGNLEGDNAIVEEMSTALQSRMTHMELVVDHKDWLEWATSNNIDYRITAFINFKPAMLYTFRPDHTDNTYACPRTWKFADSYLKVGDIKDPDMLPLLAGTLSEGVAYEFKVFCAIFDKLPTIAAIADQPNAILVPDEPSVLFALCGSIAHHANKDNVTPLLTFASRMPVEFQVVMLREMIRRDKTLMGHPAVQAWISKSAMNLF